MVSLKKKPNLISNLFNHFIPNLLSCVIPSFCFVLSCFLELCKSAILICRPSSFSDNFLV